jgi:hypothetical protein
MWGQYRRSAPAIQLLILLVTAFVFWKSLFRWEAAFVFFVAMQLSAVFGAMWAYRLKRKLGKDGVSL